MISVIVPSRGRPERFAEMRESAERMAVQPVQWCVRLDDDEPKRDEYLAETAGCRVTWGPRIVLSKAWNEAALLSSGDVLMMAADDLIFRTEAWDESVEDAFAEVPDRIAMVYCDDGYQHARLATHPFLSREWVAAVGEFVPPYFSANMNDVWIHDIAQRVDRAIYVMDQLIEHMHPAARKAEMDDTYREQWGSGETVTGMRALYDSLGDERDRWVGALREAMM